MDPFKPNVIFVISVNGEVDKVKGISPFTEPQINSLRKHLGIVRVVYIQSGFNLNRLIRNIKELREIQKKIGSNIIVHSMYGSFLAFTVYLSIIRNNKFVISFGGSDLLGSGNRGLTFQIKDKLTFFLSKYAAIKASAIIVKSKELFESLSQRNRDKSIILPNGVDTKIFRPLPKKESRSILNWDEMELIVLFNLRRNNSKLERVKNYPLALKTMEKVNESIPKSRLQLIQNKTHDEISLMMNAADCLLLTSLHEGSPNIVKEAMACNLPVVSVNCGDVKDLLKEEPSNYVTETYSSKILSNQIINIAISKQSCYSRNIISEKGLTMENVANRLFNLYKDLLLLNK